MNVLRIVIGAGLAIVVTAGLFYLMPLLIETADKELDEQPATRIDDIIMPDRIIEAVVNKDKPKKIDEPDEPPPDLDPPKIDEFDTNPDIKGLLPNTSFDFNPDIKGGISSEGEYLPIVKVAPIYPRRANSRGVEGYCTIEYTVTKTGATRDPVAIDCKPSGYFERASVKAAKKFKYKPRIIDGESIDVLGVQNRFVFRLEK